VLWSITGSIFKINCNLFIKPKSNFLEEESNTYGTLEVLGPEHEFSIVDHQLKALPIVDKVIKDFHGRVVNFVEQPNFAFGKELQLHVMEVKPNEPFRSPEAFEQRMQNAVLILLDFLEQKYQANLLGTGMHPLLRLEDTRVWPHRHRQIYQAMSRIFNLKQHGWLNIQSFQLNLPYFREKDAILLNNTLAVLCTYLPAIAASSPIYEGEFGENIDNRLRFYMTSQEELPSITGDVVPEYMHSFRQYREEIIEKYSLDMAHAGADKLLLHREWINSRGVIIRFDRRALEIRVMDEQECIKSDVALSCFIRAALRGLIRREPDLLPHEILVRDFNSILKNGLSAKVVNPQGPTARKVCQCFFRIATSNASEEEKKYLPIIKKRIEQGSLSEIISERVKEKAKKTDLEEAIINVYLKLAKNLRYNQPCF
jgi:gamma-glutamyl:cysteine ligase YbdK (ATP-grasp superfamily)